MVLSERPRPRHPVCPACAGPTRVPALCPECAEALALVGASPSPAFARPHEPHLHDDLDLWDAWSLLGDVGGRSETFPG